MLQFRLSYVPTKQAHASRFASTTKIGKQKFRDNMLNSIQIALIYDAKQPLDLTRAFHSFACFLHLAIAPLTKSNMA